VKILMELEKEVLKKYSNRTGIPFDFIRNQEESVVVLLPDSIRIEEVFEMNMPTAIIAGNIEDSLKDTVRDIGFPDEAIIVKDGNQFRTLSGEVLFTGKNIPLNRIVTIANYIYENDITPEIIVWSPQEKQEEKKNVTYKEPERPIEEGVFYKEPIQHTPPPRALREDTITLPLSDIAERSRKNIYLLKTAAEVDSGDIACALSEKLNGLHIDITGRPFNTRYGRNKAVAFSTCKYGYSTDGINVEMADSANVDTVVYEIDADFLDSGLLQILYDKAHQVYQIPSIFTNSVDVINSWIGAGFRLDGIIVSGDIREFKREWPELTFTVEEALEKI
jgi:hypothetical protein